MCLPLKKRCQVPNTQEGDKSSVDNEREKYNDKHRKPLRPSAGRPLRPLGWRLSLPTLRVETRLAVAMSHQSPILSTRPAPPRDAATACARSNYVEPTIRSIAGAFILACGILVLIKPEWSVLWAATLCFVGFNLFQSGFTQFCVMEKLLKKLRFKSELDEIRTLSRSHAEAEARAAFYDTLGLLNEVVVELSREGELAFLSEHWTKLLAADGRRNADFLGLAFLSFVKQHDRDTLEQRLSALLKGESDIVTLRFRMQREDRLEHWVEGKFARHHKHGQVHGIRGVLRDVTEAYMQEKRISHMAMHDALTGLPNRTYLDARINEAIEQSRSSATKFALLFIDLDNFKRINDLYGHKAGDQLLVSVGELLRASLRATDVLARWGGDEFVVLLPFPGEIDMVRRIASELLDGLRNDLEKQCRDTFVTVSIGVAIYPDDAESAETLLVQADKALFYAKSQGRNNIQLYADLQTRAPGFEDAEMTARFVAAVKQNLLEVHYQPVMDAANPRCPVSVEALARWHDDKYGWVNPADFIPLAENMGLIHEVGRQVLEQALDHFSKRNNTCDALKLAVNVSKRQLMSPDFYPTLLATVERFGVHPRQIKLEITESIALEGIERARALLQRLSDAGFTLSLDDFGTGFSSLSHVHELPFDEIKIDISFVRRIKTPEGRVLVKTIVDMGHAMRLALVAEGVEDSETAAILQGMGVEMLQGYHFSRPMPKEVCADFIARLQAPPAAAAAA
ncbi:Putative diguanylate cyclase/phosphodiesterase (GGDEF & EAL domains) with PAS/PAC sensor(s) [Thiobacillus denitrificans ATCC 25259]|uniref:Putative diguanylate cyclase/phosphodiesterase (GGDEF & EAL domains) with PAS/PAC sensor(S) n=2 Tax=Thiobacillus denitrificans TaxID=36861 RepID=Q3SJ51_THIDA|nr:Putative diguanylate cyclase/phosphodiesterase (GGDEF & EAL domains) with PAS/PAC sensor(s) [Thiobacillus denitrificans ATCC 25259]